MKKKLITGCCMLMLAAGARAQQAGKVGLGIIAGSPTGMTAKYWLDDTVAIDGGIGFSDNAVFYGDLLFNSWDLFPQPKKGKLAGYVGLGPRLETASDPQFGILTVAGLSYWVQNHPIEFFAEAGPVFRLAPDQDVDADGGLGVRFYFGNGKSGAR